MPDYIVEFTSEGGSCPEQVDVTASSPGAAIETVIRYGSFNRGLVAYTERTDPNRSYRGWSYVKFSVNSSPDGVPEHERSGYIPGYGCPFCEVPCEELDESHRCDKTRKSEFRLRTEEIAKEIFNELGIVETPAQERKIRELLFYKIEGIVLEGLRP